MNRKLVAYFSATGITARIANLLADSIDADIFEITPAIPYTKADLDWKDDNSRSSIEMQTDSARPEISHTRENMTEYSTIYLGFPIWWYTAPKIINTFLESYDFSGKTIIPFATSGGSGMEHAPDSLRASCPNATVFSGAVIPGSATLQDLDKWTEEN